MMKTGTFSAINTVRPRAHEHEHALDNCNPARHNQKMKCKRMQALKTAPPREMGTFMAKAVRSVAAIALLATSHIAPSNAQDAGGALAGTWVTTSGSYLFWNRETLDVPEDLVITVEIDASHFPSLFITMTEEFHPDAFAGWHGAEQIQGSLTFEAVGVVSFDGLKVHIADVVDTTRWFCDVRDGDVLECLATEAGERALSGRITLQKQDP